MCIVDEPPTSALGAGVIEAHGSLLPAAGLSHVEVDEQLEAVFRRHPELRNRLLQLLQAPGGADDDSLSLQVLPLLTCGRMIAAKSWTQHVCF